SEEEHRMNTTEIFEARRSIRRFTQTPIPRQVLASMLEAARLAPTAANAQPLQFVAVSRPSLCAAIFPHLRWAGHLPDGSASPTTDTRPTAYVAILVDKQIRENADTDAGAAAMALMLCAQAHDVASCWLGAIARDALLSVLGLDANRFHLHTVLALGYPAQASRTVDCIDGRTAYYLESPDHLCVPKRRKEDITHLLV
ncbi:MAG: nitroreductase family protein, partial [Clostridia bacterium]